MARKKAVIEKEWNTAAKNLDSALQNIGAVTEANLKDVETKYAEWDKLLKEAVAKIGKWEGEQDADRKDFKTLVEHRRDSKAKTYKKVVDELKAAHAGTDELFQQLDGAIYDIEKANQRIENAKGAVKAGNAVTLTNELGIAASLLKKNIRPYGTKSNLQAAAKAVADRRSFTVKYLNIDDSKVQAHFKKLEQAYKDLPLEIAALETHVDELLEKLAAKDPETANTDPTYKQHLKDAQKLWKSVVDETRAGMPKVKTAYDQISRLEGFLQHIGAQQADGLAQNAFGVYGTLGKEFHAVEQNIQDKIRTAESDYNKRVEAWKISTEDRAKTLKPLADRAFGLNIQASEMRSSGQARIKELLQILVQKFNSNQAKVALSQVK